jgi:hypothetical protein
LPACRGSRHAAILTPTAGTSVFLRFNAQHRISPP